MPSSFAKRVASLRGQRRAPAGRSMRAAIPRINRPLSSYSYGDQRMAARTTSVVPRHEIKVLDTPLATYTLNSGAGGGTAYFLALNTPIQGSAFYNRIGTKIAMKNLYVNGFLAPSGNTANENDYVRIMVVYDKQTNGAFPATSALLTDYAVNGSTTTNSLSGINMTNRERFVVLMDERIMAPSASTQTAPAVSTRFPDPVSTTFKIQRFIKLNDLSVMYNQTNGGTVGDIQTGGLYLVTFGGYTTSNAGWVLNASFRLKYDDV